MPDVPIPGMAFRARLTKKGGHNVVELLLRGQPVTENAITGDINEINLLSVLKQGCVEVEIDHQVPEAMLEKVAHDLFKQSGIEAGTDIMPTEFELGEESTEIDRKLAILITEVQKLHERLERIEKKLESGPSAE